MRRAGGAALRQPCNASDLAEADEIAGQETLDEREPRADADQRGHLAANERSSPTPIAAQSAAAAALPATTST